MTRTSLTNGCEKTFRRSLLACLSFSIVILLTLSASPRPAENSSHAYLGFDRNQYPGDAAMEVLRRTFAFTSYWVSPPPGEKTNTWSGKRELLKKDGYGFVVLFRGREEKDLKSVEDATAKGEADGDAAVEAAHHEGFSPQTIIFMDIEEGGRLSPQYHQYIIRWLWRVSPAYFRGGFYCSAIPVREDKNTTITTCEDIFKDLWKRSREFEIWAYNDACPPSQGCAFPHDPPIPSNSGISEAAIWQFAQSPRRRKLTARCPAKYAPDGNCYAPGDTAHKWFLDVNSATSPDPSGGAK